jgi:hypothetical protein
MKISVSLNFPFKDEQFCKVITEKFGFEFDTDDVEEIYCISRKIKSLDGIEHFHKLKKITCRYCELESLDISRNLNLIDLDCSDNNIESLDVSNNFNLIELDCGNNNIDFLDISKNPKLTSLRCFGNNLKSLDISKNPNLTNLWCSSNHIGFLNISQNPNLTKLSCGNNNLKSLDISKNLKLILLYCGDNNIESLDIKGHSNLEELICGNNKIGILDVSKNPNLSLLLCSNDKPHSIVLKELDVRKNPLLKLLYCNNNVIEELDLSFNYLLRNLKCDNNMLTSLDVSHTNIGAFANRDEDEEPNFSCKMNSLRTLILKKGWKIKGINIPNDSKAPLIDKLTQIVYNNKTDDYSTFQRMSKVSFPLDISTDGKYMLIYLIKNMNLQYFGFVMSPNSAKVRKIEQFYNDLVKELNIDEETYKQKTGWIDKNDANMRLIEEIKQKPIKIAFCKYCLIENAFLLSECDNDRISAEIIIEMIEKVLVNDLFAHL